MEPVVPVATVEPDDDPTAEELRLYTRWLEQEQARAIYDELMPLLEDERAIKRALDEKEADFTTPSY